MGWEKYARLGALIGHIFLTFTGRIFRPDEEDGVVEVKGRSIRASKGAKRKS